MISSKHVVQEKKPGGCSMKMKNRIFVIPFALLLGIAVAASAATHSRTIVDTAVSAGSFNTLVAALKAADLAETLNGEGPFTVFAPTDEAFAKLPPGTLETLLKPENKGRLQEILTYHVVSGRLMAKDVAKLDSAATVNGKNFTISKNGGAVMVDNAKVLKTDITGSNGVIHVIDSVILPN
jgi:transforming growth factor-beta-induced protein